MNTQLKIPKLFWLFDIAVNWSYQLSSSIITLFLKRNWNFFLLSFWI
jgi:hypothetical protein